ncbi:MAG: tRNA uridine-5-carboxymethylaminomethyl(34) synthesis GTPase MnmE [Calditrichia bacterium]
MKYLDNEDTIVALSTPLGKGAIAIIRLSGKECLPIVNQIFSNEISAADHKRVFFGAINSLNENKLIDQVVVSYFRGPSSYTGEDVIEISCHCNVLIIDQIIREILHFSARMANPGEFTERAFFNHKMDLSQAEAVAGIIGAKTQRSLSQSLKQLDGKLSQKIREIKQETINLLSLIEVNLDFNEEDIQVYEKSDLMTRARKMATEVENLMRTYEYGKLLGEGIKMVILGKPNVGKSSLLNAFLEKERAIVSDIPGTTRDYIEGRMEIDGIPVQVVDTAGVRQTMDPVEELGVKKAVEHIDSADILLALFESHSALDNDDKRMLEYVSQTRGKVAAVLVLNKTDLGEHPGVFEQLKKLDLPIVGVSAKFEENIDKLRELIKTNLLKDSGVEDEEVVVINSRHKNALARAMESLKGFIADLEVDMDEVILASELRNVLDSIGQIIGETTTEDLLNNIFGQFCIGK